MTDHELLESAAISAGMTIEYWAHDDYPVVRDGEENVGWCPLKFDSDALRLAVRLGLAIIPYPIYAQPKHSVVVKQYKDSMLTYRVAGDVLIEEIEVYGNDPAAATRRAIVRAAALIGQAGADREGP